MMAIGQDVSQDLTQDVSREASPGASQDASHDVAQVGLFRRIAARLIYKLLRALVGTAYFVWLAWRALLGQKAGPAGLPLSGLAAAAGPLALDGPAAPEIRVPRRFEHPRAEVRWGRVAVFAALGVAVTASALAAVGGFVHAPGSDMLAQSAKPATPVKPAVASASAEVAARAPVPQAPAAEKVTAAPAPGAAKGDKLAMLQPAAPRETALHVAVGPGADAPAPKPAAALPAGAPSTAADAALPAPGAPLPVAKPAIPTASASALSAANMTTGSISASNRSIAAATAAGRAAALRAAEQPPEPARIVADAYGRRYVQTFDGRTYRYVPMTAEPDMGWSRAGSGVYYVAYPRTWGWRPY